MLIPKKKNDNMGTEFSFWWGAYLNIKTTPLEH